MIKCRDPRSLVLGIRNLLRFLVRIVSTLFPGARTNACSAGCAHRSDGREAVPTVQFIYHSRPRWTAPRDVDKSLARVNEFLH